MWVAAQSTPQPPDHGAAGFCTDHGQAAPDERVETVARLTEIVRVEMSKGAYQMLPDELPYESAARRVAAALVAALDDESARLREPVRPWCSDPDFDQEFARAMAEHDAARAALDRVRAAIPSRGAWLISADDLRAALDPEEPR